MSRQRATMAVPVRRATLLLIGLAALVVCAPAQAQAPPPDPVIAAGVTIARIDVGGLTAVEAHDVVEAAFKQPIPFVFKRRHWSIRPTNLEASAAIDSAVASALNAVPDAPLGLSVTVKPRRITRYAKYLERIFSRDAVDARVVLRSLRPRIYAQRLGIDVRPVRMANAITRALKRTERTAIPLNFTYVQPNVTKADIGPVIVIRRGTRRLYLYKKQAFVRSFSIAVGQPAYPTPLGRYRIVTRERNPQWDPPSSPWAAGLGPIPPGPGNPLGTRWMGTSAPGIGIHGTPAPSSVGTAASHGCIRMYMSEVEWLFERVRVGTPVFIVSA
jgi:lipoprotein-anchoring transpeptidase ErfK/SrfK